jgi:protocatechuate 3,4-dioxygenase beta subunit
MPIRIVIVAALLVFLVVASFGANRLILTGKVVDPSGSPVAGATVIVYHAGVRQGYSALCPSCYADCGKRSTTDDAGEYTIKNLDPDLWFELLVVHDGYGPAFLKRVEPSNGLATPVVLYLRKTAADPAGTVRGHVVDLHGAALKDAVVETQGIALKPHESWYGPKDGLDPVAVTNDNGDFEISYKRPAYQMLVAVEARTKAQKFSVMPAGTRRQTIVLSEGAAIRGRLLANGKPVGEAEIGLYGQERGGFGEDLNIVGSPYSEVRVGTQGDGSFAITNVPVPGKWYIYAKMESIARRGATEPLESFTTRDKEVVDIGNITIGPAHRLQGKLVLSDGKSIADGVRVIVTSEKVWDFQTAIVGKDGRFEFFGLPTGKYSITPSVRGYELHNASQTLQTSVDRDVDDLVIVLTPGVGVLSPH